MAAGFLKITTTTANGGAPVANASFAIKDKNGQVLHTGLTDQNGDSGTFELYAPSASLSQNPDPNNSNLPYAVYDVWIGKDQFQGIEKIDVQVFDGITTVVDVNLQPYIAGDDDAGDIFVTPPQDVYQITTSRGQIGTNEVLGSDAGSGRVLSSVVIPDYITVHLGTPSNTSAQNITVRFVDYIKNVVCSEIYPTWPTNAILANITTIITFALNRIYTEWYRARGFNYDITNSTTVDMAYVRNREIFANISQLVDGVFTVYAHREGFRNPYFTEFCNGTTSTCRGLSQWGTVDLANNGLSVLEILRYYYPKDLVLSNAPTGTVQNSYPGTALRNGSSGLDVRRMQRYLNRIRGNYPLIPAITNVDGIFGPQTEAAVRAFQKTFNLVNDGVVGVSTWNKISQVYTAVTGLAELNGEGERIGLSPTPPTVILRQGNRGADVLQLQFLLQYISQFYPSVLAPVQDSVFGADTTDAVKSFQQKFGLTMDGVVGPNTWNKLYQVYRAAQEQVPENPGTSTPSTPMPWPGVYLKQGSRGTDVVNLQTMLNKVRSTYPQVPQITTDGVFGPLTANAVRTFQQAIGVAVDGIVGPVTWDALARLTV